MSAKRTKYKSIGLRLIKRKYTRFDMERHGDHCLPSTVAALEKKGIPVCRKPIVIEGKYGRIRCKLYWIAPEDRTRAKRLLGQP